MAQEHDDDFLRQLAGGEMTDTRPPHSTPTPPEREHDGQTQATEANAVALDEPAQPVLGDEPLDAANEPAEPVFTHPIGGSGAGPDASPRRPSRRASRELREARSIRSRLAALGALAFTLVTLLALIGGNHKRSATRHARSMTSAQRAVGAAQPARKDQTADRPSPGRGARNGTPAPDHGRLVLRWSGASGDTLRTAWRSGGTATVTGQLSTRDGRRVGDAQVSVLAGDANRPAQGARTVGEVHTDKDGTFRVRIAVDRGAPAKVLTFTYLARAKDTVPAAEGHARLELYAPVSLTTNARTRSVSSGPAVRLGGSTLPAGTIELWAKLPATTSWRRLARARAGRDGTWQAIVRLGRTAMPGIYTFQAQVPASSTALPGYSNLTTLEAR